MSFLPITKPNSSKSWSPRDAIRMRAKFCARAFASLNSATPKRKLASKLCERQ